MKTIEDIIRNNKEFFDSEEPSEGHFERFHRKLEIRCEPLVVRRSIVPYLLKAAVVTLLVTLSSVLSSLIPACSSISSRIAFLLLRASRERLMTILFSHAPKLTVPE